MLLAIGRLIVEHEQQGQARAANLIERIKMLYVTESYRFEEIIKKSRFISVIYPCTSEQAVWRQLKTVQAEHPHANHIAFAYRIKTNEGIIYRFHDAGEPTGTAGKPIFQYIEGKNLINALIVVIRYFGGVKLGAGGLTRAYGQMAKQVIDVAALQPYIEMTTLHFTLDYEKFQAFEYALKKLNGQIIEQEFAGQIHLTVALPIDKQGDLESQFAPV
ncbi:YigZ family protein [Methylobacter sp.]|uniref:IMPACT family protein n=1 Tax=Methylobacter sp. TaxID=2051955 RepID=UPI0034392003